MLFSVATRNKLLESTVGKDLNSRLKTNSVKLTGDKDATIFFRRASSKGS